MTNLSENLILKLQLFVHICSPSLERTAIRNQLIVIEPMVINQSYSQRNSSAGEILIVVSCRIDMICPAGQ